MVRRGEWVVGGWCVVIPVPSLVLLPITSTSNLIGYNQMLSLWVGMGK